MCLPCIRRRRDHGFVQLINNEASKLYMHVSCYTNIFLSSRQKHFPTFAGKLMNGYVSTFYSAIHLTRLDKDKHQCESYFQLIKTTVAYEVAYISHYLFVNFN